MPPNVAEVFAKAEGGSNRIVTKNIHTQTTILDKARKQLHEVKTARAAQITSWNNYLRTAVQSLEQGARDCDEQISKLAKLEADAQQRAQSARAAIQQLSADAVIDLEVPQEFDMDQARTCRGRPRSQPTGAEKVALDTGTVESAASCTRRDDPQTARSGGQSRTSRRGYGCSSCSRSCCSRARRWLAVCFAPSIGCTQTAAVPGAFALNRDRTHEDQPTSSAPDVLDREVTAVTCPYFHSVRGCDDFKSPYTATWLGACWQLLVNLPSAHDHDASAAVLPDAFRQEWHAPSDLEEITIGRCRQLECPDASLDVIGTSPRGHMYKPAEGKGNDDPGGYGGLSVGVLDPCRSLPDGLRRDRTPGCTVYSADTPGRSCLRSARHVPSCHVQCCKVSFSFSVSFWFPAVDQIELYHNQDTPACSLTMSHSLSASHGVRVADDHVPAFVSAAPSMSEVEQPNPLVFHKAFFSFFDNPACQDASFRETAAPCIVWSAPSMSGVERFNPHLPPGSVHFCYGGPVHASSSAVCSPALQLLAWVTALNFLGHACWQVVSAAAFLPAGTPCQLSATCARLSKGGSCRTLSGEAVTLPRQQPSVTVTPVQVRSARADIQA